MPITLRPLTREDIPALIHHANNWEIARYMTDRFAHPYTQEAAEEFLKFVEQKDPRTIFAIDLNGSMIGAVGVHPQEDVRQKNAELGYWVGREHWGNGYATEAVRRMVEYGFSTFGVDRIYASVFGSNEGSKRVLEKLDFTLEGQFKRTIFKAGSYEDEWIYAIRKKAK